MRHGRQASSPVPPLGRSAAAALTLAALLAADRSPPSVPPRAPAPPPVAVGAPVGSPLPHAAQASPAPRRAVAAVVAVVADVVKGPQGPQAARAAPSCRGSLAQASPTHRQKQLGRWLARMQAVADERVRAAGWFLALDRNEAAMRDRLATLAATSSDPVLQAFAQRACRTGAATSSACQALAPDAWPRLEPDNAAAWLALAADPRVAESGQLDALESAARAPRFDSHMQELHTLVEAGRPPDADEGDLLEVEAEVLEARADWLVTEALRTHCDAMALLEEGRRATCALIAEHLQAQAQTLPDLLQAHELGRELQWPGDRLDALRDAAAAYQALARTRLAVEDDGDCAGIARADDFFGDVGRLGEIVALSRLLSPEPAPQGACGSDGPCP